MGLKQSSIEMSDDSDLLFKTCQEIMNFYTEIILSMADKFISCKIVT